MVSAGAARRGARGFAMAALLVSLSILGLLASMALPVWSQQARREREAELIFRGEQYARAIELYQRQRPGAFPDDIDTLVEQGFLRRRYADPMVADGAFRILRQADAAAPAGAATGGRLGAGAAARRPGRERGGRERGGREREEDGGTEGGVIGVVSRSREASLRIYNGRQRYDEWEFTYDGADDGDGSDGGAGPDAGADPAADARPGAGAGRFRRPARP